MRVSGRYGWGDRHQVHLLYAPLTITGSGSFVVRVLFQGAAFAPNALTTASYRFDSYRIGYRYKVLDQAGWQLWGGVTLKVRDAKIALAQSTVTANRANIGPVPLLSLYTQRGLGPRWRAILDVEGLAAPQGRAVDAAIKIRLSYRIESASARVTVCSKAAPITRKCISSRGFTMDWRLSIFSFRWANNCL